MEQKIVKILLTIRKLVRLFELPIERIFDLINKYYKTDYNYSKIKNYVK